MSSHTVPHFYCLLNMSIGLSELQNCKEQFQVKLVKGFRRTFIYIGGIFNCSMRRFTWTQSTQRLDAYCIPTVSNESKQLLKR